MSQIRYLNIVEIGSGSLKVLADGCVEIGIKKPLIITDKGVRGVGLVDKVLDSLGDLDVSVFDGTPPNPTEASVKAALELYKAQGCDGLIAVGGGSSIDCAKGVSIAATHSGEFSQYATIEGGSPKITDAVVPLIAIPTTAGTGSEVARGAVIIVEDGRKLGFHSWNLVPKLAILDPEVTKDLPPLLTAATGMDAIAHCIETYLGSAFNPPADGIALDGLERGWKNILIATRDGQNLDARLQMLSASMQGALAFQKGLGCVHSISHSMGGVYPNLHHGTLNALLLPAVIRFNSEEQSVIEGKKLEKIVATIGLGNASNAQDAANKLSESIRKMNSDLGLPAGLTELGVETSSFERIIDGAMLDHCHLTNPRLATRNDYEKMLIESM